MTSNKSASKHQHRFVIPIEWAEQKNFFPTDDSGGGYYGEPSTRVIKLMCECGERKSL